MIPLPAHRCRRTRRLLPRKLRSNNKSSAAMIGAAAFFVTIVGVWLCVMFRVLSASPHQDSHMTAPTEPYFRRGTPPQHKEPVKGRSLKKKSNRSYVQSDFGYYQPRVVGVYAYQLSEPDDWEIERADRNKELPHYTLLTERIDPYLLSHTSQTLRRIRSHNHYPDDTHLTEVVKNYRLAIAGSNLYIKSEDPLNHLMLSSKSRDALIEIRDGSDDYDEAMATPLEDQECEATPKNAKWMLHSFPTCNFLHENDWVTSVRLSTTKILGSGYWRDVWPVLDSEPSSRLQQKKVALKTIRYEHDYTERNFDRHVRDAIVSERLTSSPLVTSIYAFCGNSGYFEFATGGSLSSRLEQHYVAKVNEESNKAMGRVHDKNDDDNLILEKRAKLSLAYSVAAGLADFHDTDAMRDGNGEITSAAIVHADITTNQFVNVGGVYKLNDFNRCRFMRRYRNNTQGGDGKPCGFHISNNPAKNRSPEEYAYTVETEKIDIYSMGNIFYSILTDMDPWEENDDEEKVQKAVMNGKRPHVPSSIESSKDVVDTALRRVMYECWEHKPEDRPRARTVADYLSKKLIQLDREAGGIN